MASANGASDEVITTTEHRFPPLSANMCRSRDHKTGAEWELALSLNGDPDTREPPTAQATAICERPRELGVIEQATGDNSNVLKVKPPLRVTQGSADYFLDRLDEVLSTGW